MRILGIQRDETACHHYRILQPLCMLKKHKLADVCFLKEGHELLEPQAVERVIQADIIVFQRPSTEEWFKFIKLCRKHGKIIVTDYDDDPFNTSPWNPYYRFVGIEEVHFKWPDGTVEPVWTEEMKGADGKEDFFSIERNIHHRNMFQVSFKKADLVTCTTDTLKKEFLKLNKNTVVLPNLIDPALYMKPEMVKNNVRIGWQGGVSHYEDLWMVHKAIARVLKKHSNVTFVYFGDSRFLKLFKDCPPGQVEYYPWVRHNAYPYKLALLNLDIGLCPVVDNKFNRNKSAIKWMEYSMVGAATIASNIEPYAPVIRHAETGLLTDGKEDSWVKAMEELIKNEGMRNMLARNAEDNVLSEHNADRFAYKWAESYDRIVSSDMMGEDYGSSVKISSEIAGTPKAS